MRNKKLQKGFTLIELMTSLSLFIIIMTVSLGSILGVFDANRKSRSIKTVMNNLNVALESMSKEMRYGRNYHCGPGNPATAQNCSEGQPNISFLSSNNEIISYRVNGTAIEKSVAGGNYYAITAPEVVIDSLTFYTTGAGTGDGRQPKTIFVLKGHAGNAKGRSDFSLQTLVSQRALDI